MKRRIGLHLNKVPNVPDGLRSDRTQNKPAQNVNVDLGRLYHHYYFDSYEAAPPDPDPSRFEYLSFLQNVAEFRFRGQGPGVNPGKRRNISSELGQAFCRWVLHDHFGIQYFAHMSRVLDRPTHAAFEGMRIERISDGDTPDYLCARSVSRPQLAEAKGRFTSVSFSNSEFTAWRQQFTTIKAVDRNHNPLKLKGYIAAMRFVTEAKVRLSTSSLFLEDPETYGKEPLEQEARPLGRVAVALHYAQVLHKLGLSLMSASLDFGFSVSRDLTFIVAAWECLLPELKGVSFIGGYWAQDGRHANIGKHGVFKEIPHHSLTLGHTHFPFVGLDLRIAYKLRAATLGDWSALDDLETLKFDVARPSQITWLSDGTVSGPLNFFRLVELVEL